MQLLFSSKKSLSRMPLVALAVALIGACGSINEPTLSPFALVPTPTPQAPTDSPSVTTLPIAPEPSPASAQSGSLAARLDREARVDGAMAMAWSPDGTRIALTTTSGVVLLDSFTLTQVAAQTTEYTQNALAFSADGSRLATADHWEVGRGFRVWDSSDLALLREYDLPGDTDDRASAMQLGFLPSGDLVLTASELSGVAIWAVSPNGAMKRLFSIEGAEPLTATLDPRHGRVAVSVGPAEGVQVWDVTSTSMLEEAPLSGAVRLQFTHDGRNLLALLDFAAVTWNIQESRVESRAPIADGAISNARVPFSLAITRDDKVFAAGTEIPSTGIGFWEVHTGQLVGMMSHDELEKVRWLSFSPTRSELSFLLDDGRLQVWEIAPAD